MYVKQRWHKKAAFAKKSKDIAGTLRFATRGEGQKAGRPSIPWNFSDLIASEQT